MTEPDAVTEPDVQAASSSSSSGVVTTPHKIAEGPDDEEQQANASVDDSETPEKILREKSFDKLSKNDVCKFGRRMLSFAADAMDTDAPRVHTTMKQAMNVALDEALPEKYSRARGCIKNAVSFWNPLDLQHGVGNKNRQKIQDDALKEQLYSYSVPSPAGLINTNSEAEVRTLQQSIRRLPIFSIRGK